MCVIHSHFDATRSAYRDPLTNLTILTATNYIISLDKSTRQMQARLASLENEVSRLRTLNEKISLSVGGTPEAGMGGSSMVHAMDRPLSPPPEGEQGMANMQHNLVPVTGEPPHEESSGSENGF